MSKTLEFKVFCFEAYRAEKKMTGRQAMQLFMQYFTEKELNYSKIQPLKYFLQHLQQKI